MKVTQSCLTLQPHGLYSPWNSLGQNTRVGSLSLLQGIFPTQGWNPPLPNCSGFFTSWATRESQVGPLDVTIIYPITGPQGRGEPGLKWLQCGRSLGLEDSLEKGMATHSSILAWIIPWAENPGRLQSMELQRVGHDWATNTFTSLLGLLWFILKNMEILDQIMLPGPTV